MKDMEYSVYEESKRPFRIPNVKPENSEARG